MQKRTRREYRPDSAPPPVSEPRWDDLDRAIEVALIPGEIVEFDEIHEFMARLEAVRATIRGGIEASQTLRAVGFLELFIAGCYEKSDEIHDSSNDFGRFVGTLFCDWIRARQVAGSSADDTVRQLLSWMARDDYGYCHQLEDAAVEVLDRRGLAALEQAVRDSTIEVDARPPIAERSDAILRAIYRARRDASAYATLCEEAGGTTPQDCEVLAQMMLRRRRAAEALEWVERGLALEAQRPSWGQGSAWRLPHLRREILRRLGRSEEAVASAWDAYQRAPSTWSYADLMRYVAKEARTEWHAKALTALDGADLASRIGLLIATREWVRLAQAIEAASRNELADLSHFVTEPAAKRLQRSHPLLAAKLLSAMAIRILDAKKAAYYEAALKNLEGARRLLLREGRDHEWRALALELRSAHCRKTSFLPGFDRIDAGRSARVASFRERARRIWRRQSSTMGRTTS